jgi:hypothetical protein
MITSTYQALVLLVLRRWESRLAMEEGHLMCLKNQICDVGSHAGLCGPSGCCGGVDGVIGRLSSGDLSQRGRPPLGTQRALANGSFVL